MVPDGAKKHVLRTTTLLVLGGALVAACETDANEQKAHEECVGFVVASDGRVALSGLVDAPAPMMGGEAGTMDGGTSDGGMHHETGHLHGTCIGISADRTAASRTTDHGLFHVAVSSLRGVLTADAPDNEGLSLAIQDASGVVTGATVVLKARMPHHDHTTPGGHGPNNDLMVMGLPASETESGTYIVDPIDFQMTKYWFFEVNVTKDGTTRRAYFAMEVAATEG